MLLVFLLRWLAVLWPGHGLAGLVDIAGPSLVRVCGVGLGEIVVAVVVVAGAPEEGLGFCADSHCVMCTLGEFEGDVCSTALTEICTGRDGRQVRIRDLRERIAKAVVVRRFTVQGTRDPLHKSR
jgi:hypothetical protein